MAVVPSFGVMEMLLFLLFGTGFGLPLGVPPADNDPRLAQVAPDHCLFYSSWAGMGTADASSENQTEQLLAEPEVRKFVSGVEAVIQRTLQQMADEDGDPDAQRFVRVAPDLAKLVVMSPTAFFCERIQPRPGGLDAQGGIVVKLGENAKDVGENFSRALNLVPAYDFEPIEMAGQEFAKVVTDPEMPEIVWGIWNEYLLIAVGPDSLEGMVARLSDDTREAPAWLSENAKAMAVPRPSTFSYVNLGQLIELLHENVGPDAAMATDILGVSNVDSLVSVSGLDAEGFVSRSRLITSGMPGGLIDLVRGEPLTASDLSVIPGDASWALAFRLDLNRWYESVLDAARQIEPSIVSQLERQQTEIERTLGVRLQDDVLGLLDDRWTLHTSTGSGGLIAGWTATVGLRDADRFQSVHSRLIGFAQGLLSRESDAPRIRTSVCDGNTIYSLEVPAPEFFLSPSWCIVDDHLVIALLPQAIRAFMSRSQESCLADQPEIATLLGNETPPFLIAYQDTRSQFELLYPFVQLAANVVAKAMQDQGIDVDASLLPSLPAISKHLRPSVMAISSTDTGLETTRWQTLPGGSATVSAPVLAALALPAIQSARGAARRAESMNHMKYFGLAMHNYHEVFKAFPAAYSADEDGKPLLSWRVHILPFLEEQALYEQFHLDEPWDSEHNKSLIAKMPELYQSPNQDLGPGMTVYLGNATKKGIFVPPKEDTQAVKNPKGISFRYITDGTSNTIAVVEATKTNAVIWTKPDDFQLDSDNPLKGLAGSQIGGFNALICDGSVKFISENIDSKILKALFTRDGGEVLPRY
jgi:hypothetical protein